MNDNEANQRHTRAHKFVMPNHPGPDCPDSTEHQPTQVRQPGPHAVDHWWPTHLQTLNLDEFLQNLARRQGPTVELGPHFHSYHLSALVCEKLLDVLFQVNATTPFFPTVLSEMIFGCLQVSKPQFHWQAVALRTIALGLLGIDTVNDCCADSLAHRNID